MEFGIRSCLFYSNKSHQSLKGENLISLLRPNQTFVDIFSKDEDCWWIHCTNPREHEVIALCNALQLHTLTCDHILNGEVKEKFEKFKEYIFVVYSLSSTERFYFITTQHGILTIHRNAELDRANMLLDRLQMLDSSIPANTVTPEWVCHAFLDTLTDSFFPRIIQIEEEASYIERELFLHNGQSDVKSLLPKMCSARVQSVDLMNLFQDKPSVIKALLNHSVKMGNKTFFSDPLLTAAEGHLNAMIETTYALEAIIARSFVNYISIMRVKMVHSNSSMEQLVGSVALVGLVLLPSHLITSAWAMNVPVPGEDFQGEGWFWGVIGLISLFTLLAASAAIWYYHRAVNSVKVSRLIDTPRF